MSSFALWCFGLLMCRRRSWLMSLEWTMLSLSCVWSHSEYSPFFRCQVRRVPVFHHQLDFPSRCCFNRGELRPVGWCLCPLCVCSDCSGSFDWMAHDPEKDLCAGPQLGSPHHCPHHQSSCAALYGVSQHFRGHCEANKGQLCDAGLLLFNMVVWLWFLFLV